LLQEQAERMASAVRDLLEHARPDAERQPVRVEEVLATIGDAMRIRLAAAGVTARIQIGGPLPGIAANRAQLELALLNVVINALDAMPQGGALTLVAEPMAQGVRIQIHDTGAGIPADVLPRIFEPWVTTKAFGRGTGLGLSITRDVITAHGGTITVATTSDAGTTFTIVLPALQQPS
jgi:signal transduction histidine kinase